MSVPVSLRWGRGATVVIRTLVTSLSTSRSIEAAVFVEACKPCGSRACSGFALCLSVGESVTVAILLYSIAF